MKVHIFFVGGTGARIYRAFVHCLASGVFRDLQTINMEFCSYYIDSDISNCDGERVRQSASFYQSIHQKVYSDVLMAKDCPLFKMPLTHHSIRIPDSLLESELFNVSTHCEDASLLFSALLGYRAIESHDDSNGSYNVVNKELLTYLAMSSDKIEEFKKYFDPIEDRVILIGSTFGVTGYSCLPQLALRIRKAIRGDKSIQFNSRIAMVCVGPYFEVAWPDRLCHQNFTARDALFDYYCGRVLKEEMHEISTYKILPIDGTDCFEYEVIGARQHHPAHVVELCAISAIINFIKRETTERCELSLKIEPKWGSVTPEVLPELLRHGIDSLLCFYIWCRQFVKSCCSNYETAIRYAEDFCKWFQEMGQHNISFKPIEFDRDKLSQSFSWYMPKKKYGLFNPDPLTNKRLDKLYRKSLHSMKSSLPQTSKEILAQYKVCSSAWELFKNSCFFKNSQLNENGWHISQHESILLRSSFGYYSLTLPTLFSRLWLCDFAFMSLATKNQHRLDFSREDYALSIASECLDLLEFLFYYADHPDLKIKRISIEAVVRDFKDCGSLDAQWLSEVLKDNYVILPSRFAESDIFIFLFRGHVIGGTSPFSFVFTSPQFKELFLCSWSNEFGHIFRGEPVLLDRRNPMFQRYLLSLVISIHHANSICRYVYSLTNETKNISFAGFNAFGINSRVERVESNFTPLIDENHLNVTIVIEDGTIIVLGHKPSAACPLSLNKFDTFLPEFDNCKKSEGMVYSSIFAPAEVKQKSYMLVQVYLHFYEETEKVKALAQESDKNAERRDYIPLQCKLKKGDKVDVQLNIYGETLLMSDKKSVVWQGSFTKCSFDYFVPKDIDVDELSCVTMLTVNGVPIGEMRFITRIVDAPRQLNPEIIAHKYNKVFISYSHQDESKVKFLHEGLELGAVPHFFDRKYLKAGDVFPQVIQDYINSADLFILCWSENASKSEYVQKERLQALERAFPQVKPEQEAKLRIYPMSIEPRAELPGDMKENYHFGEI